MADESDNRTISYNGTFSYRRESLSNDGKFKEEPINIADISASNALFSFISGRRLHIFCMYFAGISTENIENDLAYLYMNKLLESGLSERKK